MINNNAKELIEELSLTIKEKGLTFKDCYIEMIGCDITSTDGIGVSIKFETDELNTISISDDTNGICGKIPESAIFPILKEYKKNSGLFVNIPIDKFIENCDWYIIDPDIIILKRN